ncbi:Pycsar system effector family protein [Streptomyces sp. CA-294286]|uniref:Pycsar system effector family protein n=1 Tax=Streptomyces sp. CA-294286 TaxID=3240070 RepID=UPI003D8EF121
MFVEVQRADTKAAALFGVAGGLLAAATAFVLSDNAHRAGWPLLLPLGVLSLSLMAAVIAALLALRPVLAWRCDQPQQGEGRFDDGRSALRRVQSTNEEEQLLAEAERLGMLRTLARRKYRLIRLSVDLIVVAHGVAGSALLITPFTL